MDRILRGIMKYRCCKKEQMVKQFVKVRDNPTVSDFVNCAISLGLRKRGARVGNSKV